MIRRVAAACVFLSTLASAQQGASARTAPTLSAFGALKARALMRDRLPCAGCHVIEGLSGGRIGPDLSRVADRRSPDYVRRMIEDPQSVVPGTVMPRVPMPPGTRELIIAYLSRTALASPTTRPGAVETATPREPTGGDPAARRGPALYARYCAPCHGVKGGGDGPNARHLSARPARHADSTLMSRRSDDRLFDAVYAGGYTLGRSVAMPAYGETLSRSDIWALVRYMRVLCRCTGPAWSTDGEPPAAGLKPR